MAVTENIVNDPLPHVTLLFAKIYFIWMCHVINHWRASEVSKILSGVHTFKLGVLCIGECDSTHALTLQSQISKPKVQNTREKYHPFFIS